MKTRNFCFLSFVSASILSVSAGNEQGQPGTLRRVKMSSMKKNGKGSTYSYDYYKGKGGSMKGKQAKGNGKGFSMSSKKINNKGMSAKGKGKGSYEYYSGHDYNACSPLIAAIWTYASDETAFFSDVGADGFVDAGDSFIFDASPLEAFIDTTLIATGFFSGVCTATTELTPEREYCVLNYDFGSLGTVAVQGSLEAMSIVGSTGCFGYYSGEVNGYLDDTVYLFAVNPQARR
mmetsp:Transcript_17108/g.34454  ORF Transcript_17108/g.34454 Transcript_17108/m.34454 type:complete len:233 (-) Transcript_17108:56-754(-)